MKKYLVYSQVVFRVEAEDENEAREIAAKKFQEIEKAGKEAGVKVENARIADEQSGYFLK